MAANRTIYGPNGDPISSATLNGQLAKREPMNQNWYHWAYQWMSWIYNPDTISPYEYERMYETDETVFSGVEMLVQSCLSRLGDYTHGDNRIQDFVQANLCKMDGSFLARAADMLTAVIYGYSVTEKIWEQRGDYIWVKDLQTLHPATITFDIFREGPDKNKIRCAYQFLHGFLQTELPPDKIIVYSHGSKFQNLFGKSRLKRAFKSWFIKDVLLRCWGLCLERYGTPYTVANTDMNGFVNINGQKVQNHVYLGQVLDNMGSAGSLVLDEKTKIDIKYAPKGLGQDFEQAVAAMNRSIHMAIGLPSLMMDNGKTGSYSLGQQHFDNFVLVLESILTEFTEVIISQLIRPLIELNFGEQSDYGDFQREDFSAADQNMMSQTLCNISNSGIADFRTSLEANNWGREKLGMPILDEEDFEPSLPAAPPVGPPLEPVHDSTAFSFSWAGRKRRRLARKRKQFRETVTPLDLEMAERMRRLLPAS